MNKLYLLSKDKNKQNFFIYGVGQAFNLLIPLIVAPLVISVCGESGFGKIGLGFAMSLFLILIVDYAFEIKGTKQVAENRFEPAKLQELLGTTIFIKLLLFCVVVVTSVPLIIFFPFLRQESTLFFLSITIVFAQVFNPVWFLQGIENFLLISILNIASKTTYMFLVFVLVTEQDDYTLVNFFLGASAFVYNVIGLVWVSRKNKFQISYPNSTRIKLILRSDFSFCISQLFLSARQLSPLLLTGYFLGFNVAGQYKIMEQVLTLFRTFTQMFLRFFYPKLCYKFSINIKDALNFWKKYAVANVAVISFLLFFIFIFASEILQFFNLSEISVQNLKPIFRMSLFISLLIPITLSLEQLMFATNNNKNYIKIAIFATILNITLILISIKSFELYGIISSLIIAEIFFIVGYFTHSVLNNKHQIKNENNHS
ncbi:oligosaccharide flippase family protein [Flavobacterium sp. NST-5]|uniref:Oligosaccharide flippase family protein n=1 Tax=Flavobacterium ichthyis TaxID=2698827 RepID=A0ABW9ZA87_9FLAO|nr:oligosaccharide flippase family protein [Flavobacterium ichthyis]NBL65785.1 oligosaccharide flippase family protein [Flavobacterium ichthyis]